MKDHAVIGGEDAQFHSAELSMVSAVAVWCECLQGQSPLKQALSEIARTLDASAMCLSRVDRDSFGKSRSIAFDTLSPRVPLPRLERSFARSVLGQYLGGAREGTIWFKSMIEVEPDPALSTFHGCRKLSELVIVPLTVSEKNIDCLEMHFASTLRPDRHGMLNLLVATFVRTWANRRKGLMTDAILHRKERDSGAVNLPPILGLDNPAGLSRAEYRVCLFMSKGLSNKRISEELSISTSTLRTHLRSIYAKTETADRSELLYHLLSRTPHISRDLERHVA